MSDDEVEKTPEKYIEMFFDGEKASEAREVSEFRPGKVNVVSKLGLLFLKPISEQDFLRIVSHCARYCKEKDIPLDLWGDNFGGEDTCYSSPHRICWYKTCFTCEIDDEILIKLTDAYRSAFERLEIEGEVFYEYISEPE